jgi:hypothetical protein
VFEIYFGFFGKKELGALKAQVHASYKGHREYNNPTAYYVAEYNNRKRLRSLGFVDAFENLDALTAEYFVEIEHLRDEIERAEAKKRGG